MLTATSTAVPSMFFLFFGLLLLFPTSVIFSLMSENSSPFLLDAVSERFEILYRRYFTFKKDIPAKFQQWLKSAPTQKRVFATLESICAELFPDHLSIDVAEIPQRWMLPVACVALKHHVMDMGTRIELSACGRALRVLHNDNEDILFKPYHTKDPDILRASLLDAISAASRAAELEVKVAEMECKFKVKKYCNPEIRINKKQRTKAYTMEQNSSPEQVLNYLSECRAETLDALVALRKVYSKSRRQNGRLDAANEQISRLKEENEILRQKRCTESSTTSHQSYVLPKRVLSLAGYWNLPPNDLLNITQFLIDNIERRGGAVIRRDGMHVCFSSQEQELLIEAAIEVMTEKMPDFPRRMDD